MLINTAVFGSVDIAEDELLQMPSGPYGFDEFKKFALIEHEDEGVVLRWLQSVDAAHPCFILFDPDEIVSAYEPDIAQSDLRALGCKDRSALKFYVIGVVPDDYKKTTVNLKSPIAINTDTNTAMQVIVSNPDYPIRFPIAQDDEDAFVHAAGD